jgi:predicted RNA-binding protein with PUA-like domain
MNHWLVKSEPYAYSWEKFLKEKKVVWDGVRNYGARNNLRGMKKGDLVFFYHSNEGMEIVGIAKVNKEHFPDTSAKEGDWSAVELIPFKSLKKPVTLATIKADKTLKEIPLVKQSRLSVMPIPATAFDHILALSEQ